MTHPENIGLVFLTLALIVLAGGGVLLAVRYFTRVQAPTAHLSPAPPASASPPGATPSNGEGKGPSPLYRGWLLVRKFLYFGIGIALYLATLGTLYHFFGSETYELFGTRNTYEPFFILGLLYLAVSIKEVPENMLGSLIVVGKASMDLESGPCIVPFGLCRLQTGSKNVLQETLPADRNNIFRVEGEEGISGATLPEGMSYPLRVTFGTLEVQKQSRESRIKDLKKRQGEGDPYLTHGLTGIKPDKDFPSDSEDEGDPFNKPVTVEIFVALVLRISSLTDLINTFGDMDKARKAIAEILDATLTREAAKITYQTFRTSLGFYSTMVRAELRERVQKIPDNFRPGVLVVNTALSTAHNHPLNKAITGVPTAEYEAKSAILKAGGERGKLKLEGEGRGLGEEAELRYRGLGLKRMAKHVGVRPVVALEAETARAMTKDKGGQTILLGSEAITGLVGLGHAVVGSLRKEEPPRIENSVNEEENDNA